MEDLGFNYTRCLEGLRTTNLTVSHVTSKLPGDMRNLVPIGRGEPQGGAPPLLSSWFTTPSTYTYRYMYHTPYCLEL